MAFQRDSKSFTLYGWLVCSWVLVVSFQYGYNISALNQLQAVLTCRNIDPSQSYYSLPVCIPMSDATFSVVTSIFTVGGLCGSISANVAMDRWGRKGAVRLSAVGTALGAALMGVSSAVWALLIGRWLVGLGAGIGICVGPIYVSEIAPSKIRGSVGVLTQLSIVLGIMLTQALGLTLATPKHWRFVLLISAALSVVQIITSPAVVESPAYMSRKGTGEAKEEVERRLWGAESATAAPPRYLEDQPEEPLLDSEEGRREDVSRVTAITVPQLLIARELRRPLLIVSFAMLSQQLSGINAVLYYSNDILSKALPEFGPYVSLGITIVNVFMTFPPIFLIERIGRKRLLQASVVGALVSHFLVGIGLNTGTVILSSIAVMTFVTSFAIGLGPVPFVLISEVAPPHATSALSSVGLSLNWIANFIVGLVFLPLRNLLAGGDAMKEGRVFYVFAAALAVTAGFLGRVYRS